MFCIRAAFGAWSEQLPSNLLGNRSEKSLNIFHAVKMHMWCGVVGFCSTLPPTFLFLLLANAVFSILRLSEITFTNSKQIGK